MDNPAKKSVENVAASSRATSLNGVRFAHQSPDDGGRCPPNPLRYFQHGGKTLPPYADEEPSNSAHYCGQEKCGAVAPIFLDRVRSVAL
jgi:hypothetical protein